jgi:hypothetical protein
MWHVLHRNLQSRMEKELGRGLALEIVSKVWTVVRNTLDAQIVDAVDALVDTLYGKCGEPRLLPSEHMYVPANVKARLRSGQSVRSYCETCRLRM